MGSSAPEASTMNMSLDEMIASRQKGTRRSLRGGGGTDANKVSNVDRTIATSRAKRESKLRARRGLTKSGKASNADIEMEVQKQHKKTVMEKAKKAKESKRGTKSDPAQRAEIRKERREIARAAAKAKKEELAKKTAKRGPVGGKTKVAETAPLGRPPSKKAVNAAVSAMEEKGFSIPDGYQMVISFAPTASNTVVTNDSKPAAKKNAPRGRRGGGGRGGGGGGRN